MKSFQNKKAMTLVELIISVLITSSVMIIVMTFMSKSIDELRITNQTTNAIDTTFNIKDKINRFVKWWFANFTIYWTWWENTPFVLQNGTWDQWVIFAVVNDTNQKIQKDKIYGNNYVWYRLLSSKELTDIETNSWVIYDYSFPRDKIYNWARVKDFIATSYNSWAILDLYISDFLVIDENNFWEKIDSLFFNKADIAEFNFDF